MEDARMPKTDREWTIKLSGQIENLTHSIDELGNKLVDIEKNKIAALDRRILEVEKVWTQISGGWKLALVVWAVLSATGIVGLVKWVVK